MMYQQCKAVIFDLDGVLVDSEPVHIHAQERYFRDMGYELDSSIVFERFIGSTAEPLWRTLKELYALPQPVEELMRVSKIYETEQEDIDGFPPIPYIPELLKSIRDAGLLIAVASSSPLRRIRRTLESLSITEYFDVLVTGESVLHPKPAPDTFLAAAAQLQVLPEECVAVEDSANGTRSAVAAGMACVGFHNPNSGIQDLSAADIVVESFEEVDADFLKKVHAHRFHIPAVIAKTDRFLLRELGFDDLDTVKHLMLSEPEAVLPGTLPEEDGWEAFLRNYILHEYPFYGYGLWAAEDASGNLLGLYGLHNTSLCRENELEACWLTAAEYREKGIAEEAMMTIFYYAKKEFACEHFCAQISEGNIPSVRLAEKIGMHRDENHIYRM